MPICLAVLLTIAIIPSFTNIIYISLMPPILRLRLILTHVLIAVCMKPNAVIQLPIWRQLPLVLNW
jgi:hypothetical protein